MFVLIRYACSPYTYVPQTTKLMIHSQISYLTLPPAIGCLGAFWMRILSLRILLYLPFEPHNLFKVV